MARTCRACHQNIDVPHCMSPTCTWCKACVDLKQRESDKKQGTQ